MTDRQLIDNGSPNQDHRIPHENTQERWRREGRCVTCGANRRVLRSLRCKSCRQAPKDRSKSIRRKLREAGLCARCRKPSIKGRVHCVDCADENRQRMYRIREEKRKAGLCVKCGEKRPATGLFCQECLLHFSKNAGQRRKRRAELKLCTTCGKELPARGRKQCLFCIDKAREFYEHQLENQLCAVCCQPIERDRVTVGGRLCKSCLGKRRQQCAKLIAEGTCPRCAGPLDGSSSRCKNCRTKHRLAKDKRYNERIAAGLCVKCSRQNQDPSHSVCAKCRAKRNRLREERIAAGFCPRCLVRPADRTRAICRECFDSQTSRSKRDRQALKRKVIVAYGGKCVCCGTDEETWLSVEHKAQDGAEERRAIAKAKGTTTGGYQFYRWLESREFPNDRYELLCMNCNLGRYRAEDHICPHVHQRKSANSFSAGAGI